VTLVKLVMYGDRFQERPGVIVDDAFVVDLEVPELETPHSLEELLELDALPAVEEYVESVPASKRMPLAGVRLGPPLSGIGKIIAVGLNYKAHVEEMGDHLPKSPLLFAKANTTIAGPFDDLVLPPPAWSSEVDYEVELGVVIGHLCREVSPEDAPAFIGGYTIVNDVTARDVQRSESQWFRAKSYDGFCPVGPFLVTPDEVDDPQALALSTRVNGEVRQHSSTANMIFGVAQLVSFISHAMTLLPGDIIATGTPSGIGAGMTPSTYLKPGDTLELTVDGLGKQTYHVVEHEG
jgi:2-keto-4-pentenoate hydratase/2-oxohepta-3-ene-1,7-dioic acid hydratase in catechol pathway